MPPAKTPTNLVENVEFGHGLGWSFTPLSGKMPTLQGWQKRPRESLEEAVAWAGKQNVGLRTGSNSGIVAIDVDPEADVSGLDLPPTVTVKTGRDGNHLYYKCAEPLGNSVGKLAPHVDVRGDGGQVVFPGSVHPKTGKRYEWAEGQEPWTVQVADLPQTIIELLRKPDRPARKPSGPPPTRPPPTATPQVPRGTPSARTRRYAAKAMQFEIAAVLAAESGSRNHTLNKAAFNLGTLIPEGYLARAEIEEALRAAALSTGLSSEEVDPTLQSGLDAGMKNPRRIEEPATPPPRDVEPDREEYILTPGMHITSEGARIEQSTAAFADAVLDQLPADAIYRKDFIPGEVLGDPGKRRWLELSENRMRIVVDQHVKLGKWIHSKKTKEQVRVYQSCSKDAAGLVIAQARQAQQIRELHLMVGYPVYGPGFVRLLPGWRDGLYHDEPGDLHDLKPERDCGEIYEVLYDLVADFPFKSQADLQNFIGLLLTPIVAPALDGNRPMHLLNSPLERTGKTKLAEEVLGGVILGRQTPAMQITQCEEEREKRIISLLLQGETMVHLDNLPGFMDSASLSSLITSHTYSGRVLGASRTVKLPNNLTLVASGNNIQASGEIAKRVVPILLQPTSPHPEARRDFRHPDLRGYIRSKRRRIIECLLGMVENWLAAERRLHENILGGFENWSGVVGGILQANHFMAWRKNEADWQRQANPRGAEMEAFVRIWHDSFAEGEVTPKKLRELAEPHEFFGAIFAKRNPQAAKVAFGRMLTRHADMPVGEWFIRRANSGNQAHYRLERIVG